MLLFEFITSTEPLYILLCAVASSGVLLAYIASSRAPAALAKRVNATLPPGPPRLPLLGSLLRYPTLRWFETFSELQKQYGDIIYFNLAGKPLIVLNSINIAEELMGKRMTLSSGRPYRTMISEIMSAGWALIVVQPGPSFNEQRKIFHKTIGQQAAPAHDELIQNEIGSLLTNLSSIVGDPFPTVISAVGAVIIKIAYGERVFLDYGNQLVEVNRMRSKMLTSVLQKFWLVDVFPSLRHIPSWFPGAKFRRIGEAGTELARQVRFDGYDLVKKTIEAGKADHSIVSENIDQAGQSNDNLRDAAASMYAAGADTTSTSIVNFFYSMLLYPGIQERVHRELDEALGTNQIPTMNDLQNLPYFRAAWKESMRWNAVAPLGIPHVYAEADIWNGYYIPEGSIIQCNIGFMLRDPRVWGKNSHSFDPERFLPESDPRVRNLPDMMSLPFGFGRRICPGRYLAERVGMQFAAATLSTFCIVAVDGETVPQTMTFDDSTIRRPTNLRCQFKARR